MFGLNLRIRDFIVTKEGWIFAVVSYSRRSDTSAEALLRYIPDEHGERVRSDGVKFRKMDFEESFEFLKIEKPEYIVGDLHRIPFEDIKEVLRPDQKIQSLLYDPEIKLIVETFREGGIPLSMMGVTGSWLCDLAISSSDIDFVVYGESFFDAIRVLKQAKVDGLISELDQEMWRKIYNKRVPEISFDEFLAHEMRKGNRGMIGERYFDLLYVNDKLEAPFYDRGEVLGRYKIEAVVTDASGSFDSPSVFKVDHDEVDEVLSFTHTYAGQVLEGEVMEARGVLEEVDGVRRLIVGTTREARGEWIRSLTLMNR
ncbi:MAG: DNA polymerase subunit beta [Candidatus Syntropharchaeales archaeon]